MKKFAATCVVLAGAIVCGGTIDAAESSARTRDGGGTPVQAPPQVGAIIGTTQGEQAFGCSDVTYPVEWERLHPGDDVDEFSVCNADDEAYFAELVARRPSGFADYVYSGELGMFDGAQFNVSATAFVGFMACLFAQAGGDYLSYDDFIRSVFTMVSPADTTRSWDAAFRHLCPTPF
jgi:hypothetical protein